MPNHGRSPWTETFDYVELADLVADELRERSPQAPVALVGHSMGGKIAMCLALRHPELVERLVVVDVAPVAYPSGREFVGYIETMRALDLAALERRDQADEALREAVPNPVVRSFLLQNLRRTDDGWHWQVNLDLLGASMDGLTGWPGERARRRVVRRPGAVGGRCRLRLHRRRARARRWTAGSRATAGCWSRAPGTGCTPSSRRSSSRCCGGSCPTRPLAGRGQAFWRAR